MKYSLLFLLTALTLGCAEGATEGQQQTEAQQTEEKSDALAQNGDYSSLFNSPDCTVITAEEINAALGIACVDMQLAGGCSFKTEYSDDRTWYLSILKNDLDQNEVLKEIQDFREQHHDNPCFH